MIQRRRRGEREKKSVCVAEDFFRERDASRAKRDKIPKCFRLVIHLINLKTTWHMTHTPRIFIYAMSSTCWNYNDMTCKCSNLFDTQTIIILLKDCIWCLVEPPRILNLCFPFAMLLNQGWDQVGVFATLYHKIESPLKTSRENEKECNSSSEMGYNLWFSQEMTFRSVR